MVEHAGQLAFHRDQTADTATLKPDIEANRHKPLKQEIDQSADELELPPDAAGHRSDRQFCAQPCSLGHRCIAGRLGDLRAERQGLDLLRQGRPILKKPFRSRQALCEPLILSI
jgi:hypothetical protein